MIDDRIEGALASQELRQALFKDGWTNLNVDEKRESCLQPANYDISVLDECWRVPNGFRPERSVSVVESLRRLHPRERIHYKIHEKDGMVLAPDFSYLFPAEGTWKIPKNFFIRASPKSTEGRMGNFDRLVADGVPKYDEVPAGFEGNLYVLVKPLIFFNRIFPGFAFNQLRAYCRNQCILNDGELVQLINQHGLVKRNGDNIHVRDLEFDNGLLLTADLEGVESDGLIGFRSRKNPDPVDRSVKRMIDWEHYFDPVLAPANGSLQLRKGELYLTQSREWLSMTATHAGVMPDYRTSIMENRAHIAGYFDANMFKGVATLEIPVLDEMVLHHGDPCCAVQFERVRAVPDKEYGGAHMSQKFALLPKPMKLPDPAEIAGKAANEKELIMYVDRAKLFEKEHFNGFHPVNGIDYRKRVLDHYAFGKRGNAKLGTGLESDNSKKQPIAYTVFVNPAEKRLFAYLRASEEAKYAETQLHGKWSIGVGGHVRPGDKVKMPEDPVFASLQREVYGEEITCKGEITEPKLVGYINDDAYKPVDSVHFGLLHVVETNGDVCPNDAEIKEGRMMTFPEFRAYLKDPKYEV
ncbi:MAG TPA: 2'-deoxycytidine 5'-triphosphate deaminase, partial [Candidatus Binatia bacterium]|nr:2'-deoxycytidine 5'-triphosphate deaminase [Candidatus Binatia bacterium]